MPQIFLSYAREDKKEAGRVFEALTQAGFDVWWDANLTAGARFRPEIAARLAEAGCVVVLWSSSSINSDFVLDEAEDGLGRGVLVQAVLDGVKPPHGFRQVQWADLQWWPGGIEGLREVIQGIHRHIPQDDGSATPSEAAPEAPSAGSRAKKRRKSGSDDDAQRIDPPAEPVLSPRATFRQPTYGVTHQPSGQPFIAWVALLATGLLGTTASTFLIPSDAASWVVVSSIVATVLASVGAFKLAGGGPLW